MEEIKSVGKETGVVEEKKPTEQLAIFKQSEEAIVEAGKLLEGFESIYEDEERRTRATGSAGVVAGGIINYALDAANEKDPDKQSELKEKFATTGMETATAFVKTLISGERRRRVTKGK